MNNDFTYNEKGLVAALKAKDDKAYAFLYDNYAAALYSIIKQMASDSGTANDVLQEVFISCRQKIESYDAANEKLFIWMLSIARSALARTERSEYANRGSEIRITNNLYENQ